MDSPEDITNEDVEFAERAGDLAMSRVPEEGYLAMNINDYIATLTNLGEATKALGMHNPRLEKVTGMYAYLRDKLGVKKVADVATVLSAGQVDPKVVDLWIEEGYMIEPLEFDSAKIGYPDKIEALEAKYKEEFDEITGDFPDDLPGSNPSP